MTLSKIAQFSRLLADLRADTACSKITPPLVNQFALHETIPNRWFDWLNRIDSPVMIIGQDWGPYVHLKKYVDDPSRDHSASSRTEAFIIKTLDAIQPGLIDTIFFTVSVFFTRTGRLFRGSANYNERASFEVSFPYLSRQIAIVKPRIVMPLGKLAFRAVDRHFGLGLANKKLSQIVSLGKIKLGETLVIPAYHPAAFVSPDIQLKAWQKLSCEIKKLIFNPS